MMIDRHHAVSFTHGGLSSEEREKLIDDFRSGRRKVLIATDVLARGLDVTNVNLVINYDLPVKMRTGEPDHDTYLHRIGRTGRFGQKGMTINFIHDRSSFEVLNSIQAHFGYEIMCVPTDLDLADGSVSDQKSGRLDRMEEFFKRVMKH